MKVSRIKLPLKMAAENIITVVRSRPRVSFVYNGITPAMTMAMATNIKGKYVFSNWLRKKASRAVPAVIAMAVKQKKLINKIKRGFPSPFFISKILDKKFTICSTSFETI